VESGVVARIRTIKPEFWGDEKMAPMPPIDRLVFLALISMADDAGRVVDNIKTIDGFVFPESDDTSRGSLDKLASAGRIIRYQSESGQRLIQVANWLRHQKVDKPAKYVLPAPPEPSRDSREIVAESSRSDLGPTTSDQLPGTDDPRPSTSEQRAPQQRHEVLGVTGQPLTEARNDLVRRLGGGTMQSGIVDDFLNASPVANRYAWARGLVAMLDPPGGQPIRPTVLLVAMSDFLVADRTKWPFVGRVFRAFVDDAGRPRRAAIANDNPSDTLARWAAETDAKEKSTVPT
jgi:hypothetical protein